VAKRRTLNSRVAQILGQRVLLRGYRAHKRRVATVALTLSIFRLVRSAIGKNEEVVATESLKLGDVLRLEVIPRPAKDKRRAR
jgi:hypothetical protein